MPHRVVYLSCSGRLTCLLLLLLCILSNSTRNLRQHFFFFSPRLGSCFPGGGEEGAKELHNNNSSSTDSSSTHDNHTNTTTTTTSLHSSTYTVDGYTLCQETLVYSHWRTIYQRIVRMPHDGKMVTYDVVGQKGNTVIVFSWNTSSRTATILREYNPGPHRILYGLAAGVIEEEKHESNARVAAEHELEEELHLAGGIWYPLLEKPLAMDKYATTMIHAFLVLDAHVVTNPRPLDEEEDIEIIRNVTIPEIIEFIRRGEMNVVGSWAALLAIEKLRELGELK
jgi:hypothetical protein